MYTFNLRLNMLYYQILVFQIIINYRNRNFLINTSMLHIHTFFHVFSIIYITIIIKIAFCMSTHMFCICTIYFTAYQSSKLSTNISITFPYQYLYFAVNTLFHPLYTIHFHHQITTSNYAHPYMYLSYMYGIL